jgi:hypothetical protein
VKLQQKIRYLELENSQLRQESAQLRKKLHLTSRHVKRVNRAYDDALLMVMWRTAGIIPSRRYAKEQGISQNRWECAIGLLRMARIVTRRRHWEVYDLAMAEHRLEKARQRAAEDRELFLLRLNRHAQQ